MKSIVNRGLVDKALQYASEKYKGQLDDQGRPYFFAHVVQVYSILVDVTDDTEVLCAGLLHNIIEDTDTTFNELRNTFTPNVAEIVKMVTHKETNESKFFPEMKPLDEYNVLYHKAVLVKFADRLSNLSRMESWSDEHRNRYINSSRFWEIKE